MTLEWKYFGWYDAKMIHICVYFSSNAKATPL